MPTYRGITIELHSQFDVETFPEYYPRPASHYPNVPPDTIIQPFFEEATNTCSVYVPVFPGSQFWVAYTIVPPRPPPLPPRVQPPPLRSIVPPPLTPRKENGGLNDADRRCCDVKQNEKEGKKTGESKEAAKLPEEEKEVKYFLFKMYINGHHVVSWSCGAQEKWRGKTMFALYSPAQIGRTSEGRVHTEKRAFCFTPCKKPVKTPLITSSNAKNPKTPPKSKSTPKAIRGSKDEAEKDGKKTVPDMPTWPDLSNPFDASAHIEIKIHRAYARRRVAREFADYASTPFGSTSCGNNEKGIRMVRAGKAGAEHPKRYYQFVLIDAVDEPWAKFRYMYRTWAQLEELGIFDEEDVGVGKGNGGNGEDGLDGGVEKEEDRGEGDEDGVEDVDEGEGDWGRENAHGHNAVLDEEVGVASTSAAANNPFDADPDANHGTGKQNRDSTSSTARRKAGTVSSSSHPYRLSIPPSIKLIPPSTDKPGRPLPAIPQKHNLNHNLHPTISNTGSTSNSDRSLAYSPHPAYPVDDWAARTPSPVKSIREGISSPTPPVGKKRGMSAGKLMDVVTSAWRRRGGSSVEDHGEGDRGSLEGDGEGRSRSVS